MQTAWLDPLSDARWARFLARCPGASVFHHPLWLSLLRDVYRYPIAIAAILATGGEVLAAMPLVAVSSRLTGRRLVCVPFADMCGPLVGPDVDDRERLLRELAALAEAERARRGTTLEIRDRMDAAGTSVDLFHRHVIDLTEGYDAAAKGFRKSVRKNIRTAERNEVTVARHTDPAALDTFYGLHMRTRQRLGVPTQPLRFIRGLDRFLDSGHGFVSVASHEGRTVAVAVFLHTGEELVIKYSASAGDALHLRPNNAIVVDALRWAAERGMSGLDYGRTDIGQDELARYKRSWGAREETVAYTYSDPPAEGAAPGHGRLNELLEVAIKRAPPQGSRLVGELLYRHVG